MKTSIRLLCLSLVSVGVFACSDSSGPSLSGSVSASIDGSAWTASSSVQATYNSSVLAFGGMNGSGTQILITIPAITGAGTYSIGAGQAGTAVVMVGSQTWSTTLAGGTGSVVVTSLASGRAVGTFTFNAVASGGGATGAKAVSSGSFNVTY